MEPWKIRVSNARAQMRTGHGTQGFSILIKVSEFGTPNIIRGIISTGERAHSAVCSVTVQRSAAMSTPLLPGPITSTRLPANGSGTR